MPVGVYKRTEEMRRNIARASTGRHHTKETKEKIRKARLGKTTWNKGKSLTKEHKDKVINGMKKYFDKRGRVGNKNQLIRSQTEYVLWRTQIFQRDKYTCQVCQKSCCELNAHHIKPFAKFPELRLEISNGISLCLDCHNESKGKEAKYEVSLFYLDWLKEVELQEAVKII